VSLVNGYTDILYVDSPCETVTTVLCCAKNMKSIFGPCLLLVKLVPKDIFVVIAFWFADN